MAKIEFQGFVEEVLEGRNGPYGLKVSEPHRRKNDADEWVTVARTFHRVTGAFQAGIQWAGFAKGDRVEVAGRQVTEVYAGADGVKKYPLAVKADRVSMLGGGPGGSVGHSEPAVGDWVTPAAAGAQTGAWGADDASTPF